MNLSKKWDVSALCRKLAVLRIERGGKARSKLNLLEKPAVERGTLDKWEPRAFRRGRRQVFILFVKTVKKFPQVNCARLVVFYGLSYMFSPFFVITAKNSVCSLLRNFPLSVFKQARFLNIV